MKNYYELLGIPYSASSTEIDNAYYALVKSCLPSNFGDEFFQLTESYNILSNENTRKEYDLLISSSSELHEDFMAILELINNNKLSAAIKLLENITSKEDTLLIPKILLGTSYLNNKNSGKAIKLFEQLVAETPNSPSLSHSLAYAYIQRKYNKKAVETFNNALAVNKNNLCLWLGLREAYIATEDTDNAEKVLEQIESILETTSNTSTASSASINQYEANINQLVEVPLYVINKSQEALEKHSMLNESIAYQLDNMENSELIDDMFYDFSEDDLLQDDNSAQPLVHSTPKIGRNDLCPCGSGKKYKKCCGR